MTRIGKKSMPILSQVKKLTKTEEAILATLSFFGILDIPLTEEKIWQNLYKIPASKETVRQDLNRLIERNIVYVAETFRFPQNGGLKTSATYFSLKPIDEIKLLANQAEIEKRWERINKYYWLLSLVPFIEQLSVINSLALGNATAESDIDFFVVTKPRRLYFVRTLIILIFRTFGIYKTKNKIKDQFCFGFYVTIDGLDLSGALIPGEDPHFAFWFASFVPLFGKRQYERLVAKNRWIYDYCPNFLPSQKVLDYKLRSSWTVFAKRVLEFLLFIPASALEPIFRFIHIRHTFKLPENHWATSTTIAERDILKLHAVDPRKQIRERFFALLQSLR